MLKLWLYLVVVLGLWSISTAVAADSETSRVSLRGLNGVNVLVETLTPSQEELGLRQADIQTDVELKLRLAGIPVLSAAQLLETPGAPYLYIAVTSPVSATSSFLAYAVEIGLAQSVTLDRNSTIFVPGAITWHVSGAGSVGKLNIRSIRDNIKDLVDQFINAYLAVNPKK